MEPLHKTESQGTAPHLILPFHIKIHTKQEPIYRYKTAAQLRDFLNDYFSINPAFSQKGIFCVQIKYTVQKNEAIMRLSDSLKTSPFIIDHNYNRIDLSKFALQIFKDCDVIQKKAPSENIEEIISQKPKKEIEECDKLSNLLERFMKIFNADEGQEYVKSNKMLKQDLDKTREEIKVAGFLRIRMEDYYSIFQKHLFEDSTSTFTGKKSKFWIGTFGKNAKEARQGKNYDTITGWKAGFILKDTFLPFFDNQKIIEKVAKKNASVRFKSGLLRDPDIRIKKFEICTEYFQGLIIKLEFKKIHIANIYKRTQNEDTVYYFKMDYPPKFYASMTDAKLDQETGYINTWKRIQNFTLLDHDKIKDNHLLRLHLINNTVIRIQTKTSGANNNKKAMNFFDQLYDEFEARSMPAFFTEAKNLSVQNVCHDVDYQSFTRRFINLNIVTVESKIKNEELKWNMNYLILCLMSKGLISAFDIKALLDFIDVNRDFQTFSYVFDKMYESDNTRGLAYIKQKFEEYKHIDESLKSTDYDDDSLAVRIWRIQITPSGYIFGNKAPEMKNRIQREYKEELDHFMRASVLDDDGMQIKNQVYLSKKVYRKLISEFKILNRKYIPLGWSPSQLRSFSLWYVNQIDFEGHRLKRSQILDFLGKFQHITPPAKMAARIGQAFSSSWNPDMKGFDKVKVERIEDIVANNEKINKQLLFTDGIGKVSQNIMRKIGLKLKLQEDLGAIQIRYLGTKGVLVIDKGLPNNVIQIRPSMKKYDCEHQNAKKYLDILDWNKYKAGFLNRQVIILLRSRGIPNHVFLNLQNEYIKDIQSLTFKDCSIFKELANDEYNESLFNLDPANKIILNLMEAGFNLDEEPFFRGVMQILKRNGYEKLKEKSNINVPKSARLIGIIDEYKVLKQNEVYCRVVDPFGKQQLKEGKTISSQVVVVRNPCLHPADIRKLKAVSEQTIIELFGTEDHPFKDYPNTVIMSQMGDTPITSAISGSDLDGDNFWICWDENLIGVTDQDPYIHVDFKEDNKKVNEQKKKLFVDEECYDQMLDFFCDYMNYDLLGKIANSHLIKADQNLVKFAYDQMCLELSNAHGHAVDFPKSGHRPNVPPELLYVQSYPDFLEKQEEKTYRSESILGILYRAVRERIEAPIVEDRSNENQACSELLDNDLIILPAKRNFTIDQIAQAYEVLYIFSQDIERILYLSNLQNQFQIYTGNVTAKTKGKPKKNKGFKHGKLTEQIVLLKEKFQTLFFGKSQSAKEFKDKYRESDSVSLGNIFTEEIISKASLWYLVSYVQFFKQRISAKDTSFLKQFRLNLIEAKKKSHLVKQEIKQLGLIWFTIPKVLMEMKMKGIARRRQEERMRLIQKDEEPKVQGDKSAFQNSQIEVSRMDQSSIQAEESLYVPLPANKTKIEE